MFLVTGGAGFIGSNIANQLSKQGKDVMICDWLGQDNIKWKNLIGTTIHRFVAPEDLPATLQASRGKIEAVIHMGAISATTETDGDLVMRSNFQLSQDLWNWCASEDIPFVYASSAATYGDGDLGFVDGNDLEATRRLRPLNLYGWSKQLFDIWALDHVAKGRPSPRQWAGLRFFNVYGPRENHKGSMMSIVCRNYEKCAAGDTVQLFKSHKDGVKDGEQLRDFIHVEDCVNVIEFLLNTPNRNGIFNVGTGQARSFRDLITATYTASGHSEKIEYIPMPEQLRNRYQYFTQADMTHLRSSGYNRPFLTLEEGVQKYVTEYLSRSEHDR